MSEPKVTPFPDNGRHMRLKVDKPIKFTITRIGQVQISSLWIGNREALQRRRTGGSNHGWEVTAEYRSHLDEKEKEMVEKMWKDHPYDSEA